MCLPNVCPDAPQNCRPARKSVLVVKNRGYDGAKDMLAWKWLRGAATSGSDFANPQSRADYALCIYAGTSDALVAQMHIPQSSKWIADGHRWKYKDKTGAADGTQQVFLRGGDEGKSSATLKGRGNRLPDLLDSGPLSPPVTVQLMNYDTGACFEGRYETPTKNNGEYLSAQQLTRFD